MSGLGNATPAPIIGVAASPLRRTGTECTIGWDRVSIERKRACMTRPRALALPLLLAALLGFLSFPPMALAPEATPEPTPSPTPSPPDPVLAAELARRGE